MRTTSALMTRQSVYLMQSGYARMNRFRLQLSSGQRMLSFADDPTSLGAVRRFEAMEAANSQHQRNVQSARTFLEGTDFALQGISDAVIRLREVMLRETGPLGSDNTNRQSVTEIENLRDEVLAQMNQKVQGRYIFGGYRTTVSPFSLDQGVVSYNGDDNLQQVQVSPTLHVAVNVPGSELLGTDTATLFGASDLKPRLEPGTDLGTLNEGLGGDFTGLAFSVGGGAITSVNMAGVSTIQDVLDRINGAGLGINARIADDERGLLLESGQAFEIMEMPGGSTAADLGLLGSSTGTSLQGGDIRAALTDVTNFSDMRALDGRLPLGTLRIRVGGVDTDIDLSGSSDLGDVRTHILNNIPNMSVEIEPEGTLNLIMTVPETFEVTSPNGDNTASSLGISGDASPSRLFDLFSVVIEALENGDRDELRQHLVEVEDVHATIRNLLVDVGGREVLLDQTENLLRQREESLITERSRREDTDIIDAATRLTQAETAYEAALAATARLFDLTLTRYI